MYGGWTPTPQTGLYVVVDIGKVGTYHGYDFKFLYLPGDKIWRGWDREEGERKKRIGFWCFSDEVLNYDQLDLEDIEFYINCRTERRNYLDMMPILYQLRKDRLEELEREKLFVQLVVQRNSIAEEDVWKAVDWWKFKNKWKRPIDQDDAKALRMIERKLKGKIKELGTEL